MITNSFCSDFSQGTSEIKKILLEFLCPISYELLKMLQKCLLGVYFITNTEDLKISFGLTQLILVSILGMKYVYARLVLKYLNLVQHGRRVEIAKEIRKIAENPTSSKCICICI